MTRVSKIPLPVESDIPKTKAARDVWYGSAPQISDDIIAGLNIQFEGYAGRGLPEAQKMAMEAIELFGSDRRLHHPDYARYARSQRLWLPAQGVKR